MTERFDLIVVGGGIVGLATAYQLLRVHPDLRLAILEKEAELATHQSGHNSGVMHAGLYYAPGSRKALFCRNGKQELEQFADAHGIRYEHCGKIVVALDESELPRLATLKERATANGVDGLEEIGPERIREIEPHAVGIRALWSPKTGIIDFRQVALAYADEVRSRGGSIITGARVTGIRQVGDEQVLGVQAAGTKDADAYAARYVVTCTGLQSDRVASMTGDGGAERIVPFRGDYYTLKPEARHLCRGLIYPVPDPRFPFLGVHFTKRIDGAVWAGPNAVLAFKREGYRRRDLSVPDLVGSLTYRGFIRMALRYWRTGSAEMWRDLSKRAFVKDMQRYVPAVTANDVVFGPSGVRAQSLAIDGSMVDDFSIGGSGRVLHVRNAPSPAATASLAIGEYIAGLAQERFSLA